MNKLSLVVRFLFGLMLIVFGLNKFFGFLPMPEMSGDAAAFMAGLAQSGYFMPMIGGLMIIGGASILMNKYTALMIMILAPVVLNIVLFHLFLDMQGIVMGGLMAVFWVILAAAHKGAYEKMLCPCSGGTCSAKK